MTSREDDPPFTLAHDGESESETDADLRARLAEGSEARAQDLDLDQIRESRQEALEMLQALAGGTLPIATADRLIELTDGVAGREGQTDRFLELLRSLARDAMVLAAGADPEILVHCDLRERLRALADAIGLGGAMALLGDLDQAQQDLIVNANKKLLLQAVLLGVYTRTARPRSARAPARR